MRRLRDLVLAAALAGCGDNHGPAADDAAPPTDAMPADAAVTTPCALDRPGELPRPPSGFLPCDLLPPR